MPKLSQAQEKPDFTDAKVAAQYINEHSTDIVAFPIKELAVAAFVDITTREYVVTEDPSVLRGWAEDLWEAETGEIGPLRLSQAKRLKKLSQVDVGERYRGYEEEAEEERQPEDLILVETGRDALERVQKEGGWDSLQQFFDETGASPEDANLWWPMDSLKDPSEINGAPTQTITVGSLVGGRLFPEEMTAYLIDNQLWIDWELL